MLNSHLQLLKDIQNALATAQSMAMHNEYDKFASELEGLMYRVGQVILADAGDPHKHCNCIDCSFGGQLELALDYHNKEQKSK